MDNFTKATSQFYAMCVEHMVYHMINGIENYNLSDINFNFTHDEILKMFQDSKNIVNKCFKNASQCEYTGRSTKKAISDFIIDGQNIELKYLGSSKNKGTYFNTSVSYCSNMGFKSYNTFLQQKGALDELESIIGRPVYENLSPVTQPESHEIRYNKQYKYVYNIIKKKEKIARKEYVHDFFEYLKQNNLIGQFYSDMLNKYSKPGKPDMIIIYDFSTNECKTINMNDFYCNSQNIKLSGSTIIINNLKMTFGWQNGTPLNNPTIRVFLI